MTDFSPVPQDKRGFFMLPQMPEESGYYTYGTPSGGRGQYAHVQMLNFIFKLEHGWSITEERKIGIGNISLAEGKNFHRMLATEAVWRSIFVPFARMG